jgi:hypothetical protein
MTFIKYCVNLYKTNIVPMMQKMKRADNMFEDANNQFEDAEARKKKLNLI